MIWHKIHITLDESLDQKKDETIINNVSDFALKNNVAREVTIFSDSISKQGLTLFVRSDNKLILDLLRRDYNIQECSEPDAQGLIHCFGAVQ
jgi:hypothetical protein